MRQTNKSPTAEPVEVGSIATLSTNSAPDHYVGSEHFLNKSMDKKYTIKDFLNIKSAVGGSFSPDDKSIIFAANITGTDQLYIMSAEGGAPEQLTSFDEPIRSLSFSPVNNEIVFGLDSKGNEKTQLYILDLKTKKTKPLTNNPEYMYGFGGWSYDGRYIAFNSNERNGKDFDVYIMDLKTKEKSLMYSEGGANSGIGFSPDGNWLVVGKFNSSADQDIFLMNLSTKEVEHVTKHEGSAQYGSTQWLPDSSGFFIGTSEGRDLAALSFYNLSKKEMKHVLDLNHELERVSISRDGKHLILLTNNEGYRDINIYETSNLKPIEKQDFPEGLVGGSQWSNDSKRIVFSLSNYSMSSDVWVWSLEDNKYERLTKSESGVSEAIFVKPELIHYESFDGLRVPAFIYRSKVESGKKSPVVVSIHGGPASQARPGFASVTQYLVHNGYTVVVPNVRGSSGYGLKYMALDDIEKRMDSIKDLEYLHKKLDSMDFDMNRAALMGGSYGGFMVLAGLVFQPDLWAAGVDIVGISNFVTFLKNTSPYRRALREVEYGYLGKDDEFLESISPSNYIDKIKAPLFIVHGANDPRVPLSEAEQIVEKLKKAGRPVDLLVYEDEGHGLSKLKNRLDAYPKITDFLDRHLRN